MAYPCDAAPRRLDAVGVGDEDGIVEKIQSNTSTHGYHTCAAWSKRFGCSDRWLGEQAAVDRDSAGGTWKMTEDRLSGPGGVSLRRLPAHRAFWFGWYAAYPATRLVK